MSPDNRRALLDLKRKIERRTALIERKLAKAGIPPDPAIVFSIAQYYDTLKKLAKK